ncbi:LysM peptidoglycan-binding domain-containing protein [Aliifodinibius salicampi]|uniref:LysM peptidoglycan-binding domain-containing protein n=1 Tax=Fodinibius salicampi TaxID=1920655 RepID=A0ABT3Q1W2_9BACT|nr:LysM peptidoglycan-binding domain-containing protein [Fodinibius salicampi]MCW9714088.1 LysM peptidoglycan-binding domain-containing protein [Fodinibius salicampi]
MQPKLFLIFVLSFLVTSSAIGQEANTTNIKLEVSSLSSERLPYNNPMEDKDTETDSINTNDIKPGSLEEDVMQRMAGIYEIHYKAMYAQLNQNPLQAEKFITDALNELQGLLDRYPEVQSNRRFSELYRSVMTEYREFYGITPEETEAQGEIFAIQQELFAEEHDWMNKDYSLPDNISINRTEVPLLQNDKVNRYLTYFSLERPEVMEKWLNRSDKYFPMMKRIFEEEGVPTELIHLSMIESGLNPTAKSWASAVGMWQFIRSTGSMYGLEVNWWIDERQDPEKATRAAAQHLKDLYDVWGDWHLALAGYNISQRGLKRAIRRSGGEKDYWTAASYLPRETRNYVPTYLAATMIGMNPQEFGFEKQYSGDSYDYEVFRVDPLMPLETLADAAGISLDKLKEYNPELLRWATPPGDKYPLKLPVGAYDTFAANYDDIPKDERSSHIAMHTVSSGENLGYIARKYGTSVRALYETNEKLSSTIYPGQKIVVPLPGGSKNKIASNRPTNTSKRNTSEKAQSSSSSQSNSQTDAGSDKAKVQYTIKKGDTIGHIAEWFDVTASQIRRWNNVTSYIRPGNNLDIYVDNSKKSYYLKIKEMPFDKKQEIELKQRRNEDITLASLVNTDGEYTVQPNDTLIDIANKHGVSVSKIRELNGINGNRIYAGQTLKIGSPE